MITKIENNQYEVEVGGYKYNVVVEKNVYPSHPPFFTVYDQKMKVVTEEYIWEKIDFMMENVDWKSEIGV
jgi:hypothetical protein